MDNLRRALAALLIALCTAGAAACTTAAAPPEPYVPELVEPRALGPDDVVEPPEIVEHDFPHYPSELRQARLQGEVVTRVVVGRDGRVGAIEVTSTDHPLFTRAVLDVLPGWTFRPATVNGEPVAVYYNLTHGFSLR